MPRPWRPTRRCGTSCGATTAKATGRCWSAWPGKRGRDTHGRGLGASGAEAQGQEAFRHGLGFEERPEAKIAKMKDGTTHLAYKPEHAVDLDTGAVVAAELHPADEGDTTTLSKTLAKAEANLEAVDAAPTSEDPAECVADKRLSLTGGLEGSERQSLEDPDRGAQADRLFALAR